MSLSDRRALAMLVALSLAACGAAGRQLRVLAVGPTARSAFHEGTRLVSLGSSGFVAAAPSRIDFFGRG